MKLIDAGFQQGVTILDSVIPAIIISMACKHTKKGVYLGTKLVTIKGRLVTREKFGVLFPFQKNLEALLSIPKVWHNIQNLHTSPDSVMQDVCDGSAWAENELFCHNRHALQIFLDIDDIKIINPIGAHVKKHKLTMF